MPNPIKALNWRYATKEFDKDKKLKQSDVDMLTEAMRLSASSYGLQPWKFIVVTNPEIRKKLRAAGWDQSQITDASHLIVIAVKKNIDADYVDQYVKAISETRGIGLERLSSLSDMMKNSIKAKGPEGTKAWSTRQVYIPLGTLLLAAAEAKIDAAPMEGFDTKRFDEILGLERLGLESVVIAALGYRSKTDKYAAYEKVRFPREEVIMEAK